MDSDSRSPTTHHAPGDGNGSHASLHDGHFRDLLDATGEGIYSIDTQGRCTFVNRAAAAMLGYRPEELLGRNMHDVIHHSHPDGSPYPVEACPIYRAFRTGEGVRIENEVLWRRDGSRFPARYSSFPIREGEWVTGAVVTFSDRSEQQRARAALRESEARFRMMAATVPDVLFIARPDGHCEYANERFYELTGLPPGSALGRGWEEALHPDDRERNRRRWAEARATGEPFEIEYRLRTAAGAYRWYVGRSNPMLASDGSVHCWFGTVSDVHDLKRVEADLRRRNEQLELIHRASTALTAELDLQKLVQTLTDITTELTGARFGAFFYNVFDPQGEAYMLYTLSGAPLEAFSSFPMPRKTRVFGPTFDGDGVIRVDDVTRDPRYGRNPPYRGMPEGHLPVRSYLAAPVVSRSGEVLGGLFFGHPEPGVFDEEAEHAVVTLASHAAVAIDNARLFEEGRRFAETLEQRVVERTTELSALNRELEAFSYSVSHDLRAPLRTIDGFADALLEDHADDLDDDARHYLRRIRAGAERMGELIESLLQLSRLSRADLRPRPLDLAAIVHEVAEALAERHPERRVEVRVDEPLPAFGDPRLLKVVLENLLDNAWKFTSARERGRIEVALEERGGERVYRVRDNGVGFDPSAVDKMFMPFRRLHAEREFAGSGIGLATVQRIVHRHAGRIWAAGAVGEGATVYFTLPERGVVKADESS